MAILTAFYGVRGIWELPLTGDGFLPNTFYSFPPLGGTTVLQAIRNGWAAKNHKELPQGGEEATYIYAGSEFHKPGDPISTIRVGIYPKPGAVPSINYSVRITASEVWKDSDGNTVFLPYSHVVAWTRQANSAVAMASAQGLINYAFEHLASPLDSEATIANAHYHGVEVGLTQRMFTIASWD